MACAQTKQQEYKEKGDDFMATKYASFLSDEERSVAKEEGIEEGINEGMNLAREIIKLLKADVPVAEIASRCRVTTREVEEFRVAL